MITHLCSLRQSPTSPFFSTFLSSSPSSPNVGAIPRRISIAPHPLRNRSFLSKRNGIICGAILPVDPWAPNIDSQSIASQIFAFSLFPYIGFLYFITKSKTAPKLTLFGFYFLLAFVGATIPAGIYAKVQYGTSLSNVDWLHGGAESLLTLTNLFIVLGLRGALRKSEEAENSTSSRVLELEKEKS